MNWMNYPIKEQIKITDMYSLFEQRFGYGFEAHGESHNFWECVYVMEGEICASADARVYNLAQGFIVFHKPLEFHKFTVKSKDGTRLLIFSFHMEGYLADHLKEAVFQLSDMQKSIISDMLSFIHARTNDTSLPEKMIVHYLEPFHTLPNYSQILTSYLQLLMLYLAEENVISPASSAPDALIFRQAISYLNSNVHKQPSIPEIARFCNISTSGLQRIFDKYAGIGIHKYLMKLKINTAIKLLNDGESVSNVAEKLGFSSQNYFSRAFRRETGVLPSSLKISQPPSTAAVEK